MLQQLAQITGQTKWQEILDKQLHYLAGAMAGYPPGHSYGLLVMMDVLYPTKELVCVLSPSYGGEGRMRLLARLLYLAQTTPGLSVTVKTEDNAQALGELAPYTRDYPLPGKGAMFYLCSGSNCMPPVTELGAILDKL